MLITVFPVVNKDLLNKTSLNFGSISYSCVILCKLLSVFMLQFPPLYNGYNNSMCCIVMLRGLTEIIQVKFYVQSKHLKRATFVVLNQ